MNPIKLLYSKEVTRQVEKHLRRGLKDKDLLLRLLAVSPLVLCIAYTLYVFNGLSPIIPLWYTKVWGNAMLTSRINIYVIPAMSALFTAIALILSYFCKKLYFTFLSQVLLASAAIFNLAGLLNVIRISYISSQIPLTLIQLSGQNQSLVILVLIGFFTSFLVLPRFTVWAFKKGLVTDPSQHTHPGMILAKPSARGGGFIFSVIFAVLSLLFLDKTPIVIGMVASCLVCGIIGILDDLQNTSTKATLKFIENPLARLLIFLPIPIMVMMAFGIVSGYINNPFDGGIVLTNLTINFSGRVFTPLPYLFTLIWTLAIMNMISWSNGVDGQFGGVAGISLLIIGVLALRLVETEPSQINTAKIAFLAAGVALGFIPHSWHPSKIMWGFGAVSIGLLLSSLSIVSRAKVATAIMVIMIPFLDGLVTIVRRVIQKKNPLKGDRGHLHHLLLERGWSPKKVAVFYWIATAFFGVIGLISADKSSALITLTLGGIVASGIIFLNVSSEIGKRKDREIKESEEGLEQQSQIV